MTTKEMMMTGSLMMPNDSAALIWPLNYQAHSFYFAPNINILFFRGKKLPQGHMYIRVCDTFFVTQLVRQFYSSFCSQSKSGTFNNVGCVFILQDAFYDFKFVGLAGKSCVNCLSLVTLDKLSCWFLLADDLNCAEQSWHNSEHCCWKKHHWQF